MLICVSPPPRFDRQPSTGRRRQSQGHEENARTELGKVFVNEDVQPEIRVNNIEVTTPSNRSELVVLYNQHVNSPNRSLYVFYVCLENLCTSSALIPFVNNPYACLGIYVIEEKFVVD